MPRENGICAIVPKGQKGFHPHVFGMGILVTSKEILTCAHVVCAAIGEDWLHKGDGIVQVCFVMADGAPTIDARVDQACFFPVDENVSGQTSDIAVLELLDEPPPSAGVAVLRRHRVDVDAIAYGFRAATVGNKWQSHPHGEYASGRIVGGLPGGLVQFDGLRIGGVVEKGYSGAAVYDRELDAVVGMMVEADRETEKRIAQFIDQPSLLRALSGADGVSPRVKISPVLQQRVVRQNVVDQAQNKIRDIEEYLEQIAETLPSIDPAVGLEAFLEQILTTEIAAAQSLRIAFGFPAEREESHAIYNVIGNPNMRSFLAGLSQRLHHILWRFEVTLLTWIKADWRFKALEKVKGLKVLCEPTLVARRPTILEVSAALNFKKDFKGFAEVAPDPSLYAALRALSHATHATFSAKKSDVNEARTTVINFIYGYLRDVLKKRREIDDTSNAWWALRTGIDLKDDRFYKLLPKMAGVYSDVKVPPSEVTRLAAVPEIYVALRIASYTLSNIQAIFESKISIGDELADRLHGIIEGMMERLLSTPISKQLYLASVHHEGLNNYLDYIKDQNLKTSVADAVLSVEGDD